MSQVDYKIILIGNTGVGKTSIFRKLDTGEFSEGTISTIGVEKKENEKLNKEIEALIQKEKKKDKEYSKLKEDYDKLNNEYKNEKEKSNIKSKNEENEKKIKKIKEKKR